ncbi:MAG: Nramp family divalent metal transporter, partial [Chloroflexota bacterium]
MKLSMSRLMPILAVMGPGIIAAAAGNDAGAVATYSSAGAAYGYSLLWLLLIAYGSLALIEEMVARMGAVTGKGLSDLIRENYGVRWTILAMLVLLVANVAVTVSEFAGIAAGFEIFGVSRYVAVPLAAVFVWWMVVHGSYRSVEKLLIGLALLLLSYVAAGFIVHPDPAAVARGIFVPAFRLDTSFVLLAIAIVGTTICPWMLFYLQSSVVDKGVRMPEYGLIRLDVLFGVVAAAIVAFFLIVVTAATLYPQGILVENAADAALALS